MNTARRILGAVVITSPATDYQRGFADAGWFVLALVLVNNAIILTAVLLLK